MTAVIGIDPSLTSTGIAVITNIEPPKTFRIKTSSSKTLGQRLMTIQEDIIDILKPYTGIDVVGFERGFSGGAGPTAIKLGAALGASLLPITVMQSFESFAIYDDISPKTRALYMTGNGNADKEAILEFSHKHFHYEGTSDDEADAIGIAYFAAEVHLAKKVTWKWVPHGGWPTLPTRSYDAIDVYCKPRGKK